MIVVTETESDMERDHGPSWTVPASLSPSRVESFLSCPLAFRFSSIQRLPDPPTQATTKGSLVHRALERLFLLPPDDRTPGALDQCVAEAITEYQAHPDFTGLTLEETALALDVAVKTVQRTWVTARAWLRKEIGGPSRLV